MTSPNINEIFFPYHNLQIKRVLQNNLGFAHYTNADTAYKIIKNQEFWLRNISVMNDFREFEHGKDYLLEIIKESKEGKALAKVFNELIPDVFDKVVSNFEKWAPYIKDDLYILCLSEHEIKNVEEDIGKLSMWRAYGGNSGVSIIFKNKLLEIIESTELDFSSVAYMKNDELKDQIGKLGESISKNKNVIQSLEKDSLEMYLFNIFRFSALCNKHKGFEEEKEWRLIATASTIAASNLISHEILTIDSTPQKVIKVNFKNLLFKDLIERVIIGPCQHRFVVFKSIVSALESIGVEHPEKIINISDIPLRVKN